MASVKRWTVTYTKHMKQKRKVYQDGFLELQTSTNKVLLYDDCEKLLECRILKKDEVVNSGETLTFNAYLIDVADPDGDHNPTSDSSSQGRHEKNIEAHDLLHGKKLRNHSVSRDTRNDVEEKSKMRPVLSPSQKIIREFKKRELHKYQPPQTSPLTKIPNTTEWQVLYTTQVTQKAKKYHDGFLHLATCGSLGRQVMLFDTSRKLLDRRFLKTDEVIRSGESITFDAHLVEIGEHYGDQKPLMDLNVQGNNCNDLKESRILHRQKNFVDLSKPVGKELEVKKNELDKYGTQSSPDTEKPSLTEWQVLYTTQLTQKAKKYHDGFLQLAICGSLGRQVLLYDERRKSLDSRFLKKDEVIRSGESISFDTHLVEIGDTNGNHKPLFDLNNQLNNENIIRKAEVKYGRKDLYGDKKAVVKEWDALYTSQMIQKAKKYHSGILKVSFCGSFRMQVTLLTEDKAILSSKFLSLSEDVQTGSLLELPKYLVEVGEPHVRHEGAVQKYSCSEKDGDSNFSISRVNEINLSRSICTNKPLRDANQILSYVQKPTAWESIVEGNRDNSTMELASSKGLQVFDTDILESPKDGRPPRASLLHHEPSENIETTKSSENMDFGNSPNLMTCEVISCSNGSEFSKAIDLGNSPQVQPLLDEVDANTQRHDGVCPFGNSSSIASSSHGITDNVRNTSMEHTCTKEINELPSFDLGF